MHALQDERGDVRLQHNRIHEMRLFALDAWVRDAAVLVNSERVRAALYAGAAAGGATVVGEEFYTFPNGAVTGVLVLAQSHLSIPTWPEFALANVDLLAYGNLRGEAALDEICAQLDVSRSRRTCIARPIG